MIFGAHFILYSTNSDADRVFLRDVLGWEHVDIGHGWLIFKAPPSELAVHPAEQEFVQQHADQKMLGSILYLMCDDLEAEIRSFAEKGVTCGKVEGAPWGIATSIPLPSGASLGLYQPLHHTALT